MKLFQSFRMKMGVSRWKRLWLFLIRRPVKISLSDEDQNVLTRMAEKFLLAGGMITLSDWKRLTWPERNALARAGKMIATNNAVNAAVASFGEEEAASVQSATDGGDMAAELFVEKWADELSEKAHAAMGTL